MRRSTRWQTSLVGLALGAVALLASCTDQNSEATAPENLVAQFSVPIGGGWDLNDPTGSPLSITSSTGVVGRWEFPVPYNVGTGRINPFLRVQASPWEWGFNTAAKGKIYNNKDAQALPLNHVPTIKVEGGLYRQFILDANENSSGTNPQFSIDIFDLWLCADAGAPAYSEFVHFEGNSSCWKIYDLDAKTGFATSALTSGSGNTLDYNILIPEAAFVGGLTPEQLAACSYQGVTSLPCGVYVILKTQMGYYGGDWITDATFEEFSTIKQPYVTVAKNATPAFTREYLWEIEKSADPSSIQMLRGDSDDSDYDVVVTQNGHEDSAWRVTGQITVHNPSGQAAIISGVTDVINPGEYEVVPDCPVTFPYSLAAGGTLMCSYLWEPTSDPGQGPFTNEAEVGLEGLSVYSALSDAFSFTVPTSEINKTVDVTDTYEEVTTSLASDISTGNTYTYSRTFTCDADEGAHNNVAKVIGDGGTVLDEDDATVTVSCGHLTVTKTARTSLTRTWNWTIDKSVTPATWDLFSGDDGTSRYTVSVDKVDYTDSNWAVDGTIHVENDGGYAIELTGVSDAVNEVGPASVDCGVSFPYTLDPDATLDCTYSRALPDGSTRVNTATASFDGGSFSSVPVDVLFGEATVVTPVNASISVSDTNGQSWGPVSDDASWNYNRTFSCDTDEGTHDNTATVTETGQSDGASVTVNCYAPTVTKDAEASLTRTWNWTIDKTGSETALTLALGETYQVSYNVVVDATFIDSDWMVDGEITITNPNPSRAALLTRVSDLISMNIGATVDCPSLSVPSGGGTLTCSYSADLPDDASRTNTATAALQNHSYDYLGAGTATGTTDFSGAANVDFSSATIEEIDECIDVVDDRYGSLGTVCAAGGLPHTFTYSMSLGPYDVCGSYEVVNTASFVTNDTGTTGTDSWTVLIDVPCLVNDQTAWAANGDQPGFLRYLESGNWATYVEYGAKTVNLYAGQTMLVGTVTFSAPADGKVTITINLTGDWSFYDDMEKDNLMVQDYEMAPTGINPSPGLFAWKWFKSGSSSVVTVPANNFYGVHAVVVGPPM